jgi:sporulation protein YhbH
MPLKMESDLNRFRKIVRGKIKKELRRFISSGDLIGRQGKKLVTIPLPRIDLPHFQFGSEQQGGVGQGKGEVGDSVGQGEPQPGEGQAGDQEGQHTLEVDVTLEELAQILGEELELPNIENKGKKNIEDKEYKYTGILKQGPESLKHFKRTYKEALKRSISAGLYNADNPIVIPIKDDRRYRSYRVINRPVANAAIIYMMDVSGSMGDEQKEIVRLTSFWIDTWLQSQYKDIDRRYIIHDATAREVDQPTFYKTKESGGTLISSAYKLAMKLIEDHYPSSEWNIYLFHFSDGDNWSGNDTAECMKLLEANLLPVTNLFCYGQVESRYGSGQFLRDLHKHFGEDDPRITTSQIKDRDAIMDAIKTFLSKGK